MFKAVESKVSFPRLEEGVLDWWRQHDVFRASLEARKGAPLFMLYEGPPTANGSPGIHHVLARVFKDVIPRYKVMKGFYAPRIAGWDTHGLPVELEVEKELGFSGKAQIEDYGIAQFNQKCRESVFRYLEEWNALTERIGFWVDLEHPYITMKNEYIETVWWALKTMWDKGLIYQGYRVTPHCPRCGTSLSSHEVALGYKDDTEDPSIYIKFKVAGQSLGDLPQDKPVYLLAWTTTPWTLPGNTALAVAPDAEYALVATGDEYIIVASMLLTAAGLANEDVVAKMVGRDLVGLHYSALYGIPIGYTKQDNKAYRVVEGDFVSMDEGTGIVHIAPGYGQIDFEVGQCENLPLVHSVDLAGIVKRSPSGFTPKYREDVLAGSVIPTFEVVRIPGAGKFVKDADKDILADLEQRGLLFRSETVRHTYPFCWRCDAPLLYYAKETWYIRTTTVKEGMLAGNEKINWYPEHIKYGRFGDWLQNNVDWAFSRERYWGTPLPVWRCEDCGHMECVGGLVELKNKTGVSGLAEPLDLHRPFVDEVTFTCSRCGRIMRRVPEVIDCWFDSGAMPISQCHYPFENGTLLEDGRFPADYICEAVDQTRGWFYSLHAISTMLFDRPSYKNVICLGHILAADGEKMSKTRGNVVEPGAVIDKYGADALRWYLLTSSPPGNVRRFDEKAVAEISRRFLLTLWNVYSFFVTYANIDNFVPAGEKAPAAESELDRWIISELNQLILDVDAALDGYNPTEAGRRIEAFVDGLSNWYVRRSRRRFWKSENDSDKLSAYNTLYDCLVTLAKLMAPLAPFLAEEIYRNLAAAANPGAPQSVHLAAFPVANRSLIDSQLSEDVRLAMKVSSLGRAARSKAGIKVRQPVEDFYFGYGAEREKRSLERMKPIILEELNAKELRLDTHANVTSIDPKYYIVVTDPPNISDMENPPPASTTAVNKNLSDDLIQEGMAREIVRRIQNMRRAAGFDIADHIVTYYQGEDYINQVMAGWADYIRQETLSRQIIEGLPSEGVSTESHKLSGHEVTLGVVREDPA